MHRRDDKTSDLWLCSFLIQRADNQGERARLSFGNVFSVMRMHGRCRVWGIVMCTRVEVAECWRAAWDSR
jgi:hypothetical protein